MFESQFEPQHWLDQAERCRAMARDVETAEVRLLLLDLARDYDRKAERLLKRRDRNFPGD